jgi:hypothetical protein
MAKVSINRCLIKCAIFNAHLAATICKESLDEKDLGYRVRRLWIAEGDLLEAAEHLRDAMEAINRTRKKESKDGRGKKVSNL